MLDRDAEIHIGFIGTGNHALTLQKLTQQLLLQVGCIQFCYKVHMITQNFRGH